MTKPLMRRHSRLRLALLLFCGLSTTVTSCGGGSGGESSAIEGTWRGSLIQGVILCSDGTGIGACGGCTLREVTLEVSGSDEVDSVVQAIDESCLYEGKRTSTGFAATAVSGCGDNTATITFTILGPGNAALKYRYDIDQSEPDANGVRCTISPDANLLRE